MTRAAARSAKARHRPAQAPGRPRKISRAAIVSAAQKVMAEDGFDALSMRSLASKLGVSHPTLYTYIDDLGDVESEVLESFVAQLPRPSAQEPAQLRRELSAFLAAMRAMAVKHPQVVLPPIGTEAWAALMGLNLAWIDALAPHEGDPAVLRSAYNALISFVAHDVERERTCGPDSRERAAKAARKRFPGVAPLASESAFQTIVEHIIDRMLPGLTR